MKIKKKLHLKLIFILQTTFSDTLKIKYQAMDDYHTNIKQNIKY